MTFLFGQPTDRIKIKLVARKEVIRGARVTIKDQVPRTGTTTDLNGLATLEITRNRYLLEISFLGPYVQLRIEGPIVSYPFLGQH